MEKFKSAQYERLQSDEEEENEDLPPQVHVTAPGGEGTCKNGSSPMIFYYESQSHTFYSFSN